MIPEETCKEVGKTGKGTVRKAKQEAVSRLILIDCTSVCPLKANSCPRQLSSTDHLGK